MRKRVSRKTRIEVGTVAEISERESLKFSFERDGFPSEGFVVKIRGKLRAYVNRCAHAGTALDYGDGGFLTDDGRFLICRTHGALYSPEDGSCAGGPCNGRGLRPIDVVQTKGGKITVRSPEKGKTKRKTGF